MGGDRYKNPVDQLSTILLPSPKTTLTSEASPYSELDCLYLQVLLTRPDPSQLVQILKFFLSHPYNRMPFPRILDDLLNLDQGTVATSLNAFAD